MSIQRNFQVVPSQTTDHHPCSFCQVYMCLKTKTKKLSRFLLETQREKEQQTTNQETPSLFSHKDYQENTKLMFCCLQTNKKDCDILVTLFIVPEKFQKQVLPNLVKYQYYMAPQVQSSHQKYYCKSSHRLRQKWLSKQIIITVNRLGHVQLKGNLKKMALMKLEDIVQLEDAINKEFYDKVKQNLYVKINCVKQLEDEKTNYNEQHK